MKKYCVAAGVLAVLLAILCFSLWRQKNYGLAGIENLCQNSAATALEDFTNYKVHGAESYYLSGVAEFRSYMKAYLILSDTAHGEYAWCNNVYGYMTLHPQKVQGNIQGLIDALEVLAKDYDDPKGFNLINVYSNQLKHGND